MIPPDPSKSVNHRKIFTNFSQMRINRALYIVSGIVRNHGHLLNHQDRKHVSLRPLGHFNYF